MIAGTRQAKAASLFSQATQEPRGMMLDKGSDRGCDTHFSDWPDLLEG
jgi:hypothetical protein